MSPAETQFLAARAERDAALLLFKSDLGLVRADLNQRGVGGRLADRIGDSTLDMVEDAVDYAAENKGKVAAGVAAAVLLLARGPLLDGLAALFTEQVKTEPERLTDRLRNLIPISRE